MEFNNLNTFNNVTNQEKLEKLKEWLKDNNIPFDENHKSRSTGFTFDLKVKKPLIAVCISSDRDDEVFNRIKRTYAPFFIRESETAEFIIEKMQNCIVDRMMKEQKKLENAAKKEEGRRIAEESERRHQEKLAKKAAAQKAAEKPRRKRVRIQHFEKIEPRRRNEDQG